MYVIANEKRGMFAGFSMNTLVKAEGFIWDPLPMTLENFNFQTIELSA
jgi:hypothetical protein